jgi:hypothetical protein
MWKQFVALALVLMLVVPAYAVSFGAMTSPAAATTATFSVPADTVFAAGDVLMVVAPAPQDGTLADLGFSFAGTRS